MVEKDMSRRRFLVLASGAAAAAVLAGCVGKDTVESISDASEATSSSSCPRGLSNDPYPGKCRLYVDNNGNGICDLSEA